MCEWNRPQVLRGLSLGIVLDGLQDIVLLQHLYVVAVIQFKNVLESAIVLYVRQ
jgi:hypothetical protein